MVAVPIYSSPNTNNTQKTCARAYAQSLRHLLNRECEKSGLKGGAQIFNEVYLLYGPFQGASPAPFVGEGLNFPESYAHTVRRMELLADGVSEVERRYLTQQIAKKLYRVLPAGTLPAAGQGTPLWQLLDAPPRLDCYTGKALCGVGLYMLGVPRGMIQTRNDTEHCCAYASSDQVSPPPGFVYYSDCTDEEGPQEMCADNNCQYNSTIGVHPRHPGLVMGELYLASKHGGFFLSIDGTSEVENFLKIRNDDGEWYYVSVFCPHGPFKGSGGYGDSKDKEGRYLIISANGSGKQYWTKGLGRNFTAATAPSLP